MAYDRTSRDDHLAHPNPPSVPTTTTTPFNPHSPDASTIGEPNEDDGDELPYSQSDFLPTTQPTSNTQTDTTAFIDMTNNNTTDVGQNGNQHVMRKTDRQPRRNLGVARLVAPTWQVGVARKGKHKQ